MDARNRLLPLLALTTVVGLAQAQTITVDVTDGDAIDVDPGTATIADLPGPDGHISFSEAMIASNNTPGRQTIAFAIPTSEWTYLPGIYPGRAVITGMMFYANATEPVTIDGTTQTAFTGDTNPNGKEVVIFRGGGLYITADDCIVRGLDLTTIYVDRARAIVEDNSVVGLTIYGVAGSGALVRNNTRGGFVKLDQSNDNVVVGNVLHQVRVLGWAAGGFPATNNRIGGPTLAERNFLTGNGSLNSQFIPGGYAVQLFDANGTTIENNWIGTTPDGLAQGNPYATIGIWFDGVHHDTLVRDNRIAGLRALAAPPHGPSYYLGTGIQLDGTGSGVTIVGNTIGLNANGAPVLGCVRGIVSVNYFQGPVLDVVIGGTSSGLGNEIAGQDQEGIVVANTYPAVRIQGNSLHDNDGLGIDLVTSGFLYGVTPNDALDADIGGNGLQNFPIVTAAAFQGTQLHVQGTLASSALGTFSVDLFASPACDANGFGEGALYLGTTSVATDAAGDGAFDALLSASVPAGWVVTATATREPIGATSEFSACVPITGAPAAAFCAGDGSATPCPCGNSGATGRGCANSVFAAGAELTAVGQASVLADGVRFDASGLSGAFAVVYQGATSIAPIVIDDGIGCVGGPIVRLGSTPIVAGTTTYPGVGDPLVSVRGAIPPAGGTRYYQCFYRNSAPLFCPPATSNRTNGVVLTWTP
ncbi:MAG: right-handed parallel beta-helix repeat-containing protein [Planctomycetes bacterium]|nr:right-handed parallel beta-helix repeat-containing protein [Planctomycetota bacterium]